jgi:hypothetical protein
LVRQHRAASRRPFLLMAWLRLIPIAFTPSYICFFFLIYL